MAHYYLWVSVFVGLAQVLDSVLLVWARGRLSRLVLAFSVFEWIWGGFSVYVLLQGSTGGPRLLAVLYVSYLLIWILYGSFEATRKIRKPEHGLTPNEAIAGGIFGLVFLMVALFLAWSQPS